MANRNLEALVSREELSIKDRFSNYCENLYKSLSQKTDRHLSRSYSGYGSLQTLVGVGQIALGGLCIAVGAAVGNPYLAMFDGGVGGANLYFGLKNIA